MKPQNKIILMIATLIVRFTYFLSRTFRMGEGSSLPGKITLWLFPNILELLIPRYKKGWILITGTNGKTTTTKILVELIKDAGYQVATNAKGANLLSGIITSILLARLKLDQDYAADYAVFEIDEAVLLKTFNLFQPQVLVITNLSRDQLDRYGEVDYNVNRIIDLLKNSEKPCRVALNGNDPNVVRIGSVVKPENRFYFGIKEEPAKDSGLLYERDTAAGGETDWEPPQLDLWADSLQSEYLKGSRFRLGFREANHFEVAIKLPGVYNVLNSLAALAVGVLIGNDLQRMVSVINNVTPSYGRSEFFNYRGASVFLFLAKNPVGYNHVIQLISRSPGSKRLLFLLNDRVADGRDVSWIWDVSFNNIWKSTEIKEVVASGTRAGDMALRLKYSDPPQISLTVDYSPERAFKRLAARLQPGEELLVLANYTSMLKFRVFLLNLCRRSA